MPVQAWDEFRFQHFQHTVQYALVIKMVLYSIIKMRESQSCPSLSLVRLIGLVSYCGGVSGLRLRTSKVSQQSGKSLSMGS